MADLTTSIINAFAAAVATPGATMPWLTTDDDVTPTYALNTNNWAYGLSTNRFRSRAVWNAWLAHLDGPTLLMEGTGNSRFAISAKHFNMPTSGTIRWIKADGTVITRTVAAGVQIGTSDIWLVYFTTPILGSDVAGAKLLPSSINDYMAFPCPGISVKADYGQNNGDQFRTVAHDIASLPDPNYNTKVPADPGRFAFYEAIQVGASGSPMYTVINGQECLLGCWFGFTVGPMLGFYKSALEAAATTMAGSAVTFAVVDLSSFTMIPPTAFFTPVGVQIAGANVALHWTTTGATSVSINQGIGAVAASGSTVVQVNATKVFTLTATGPSGVATATLTVEVRAVSTKTLNTAPVYNIVSYTDLTMTMVVSGDARATILKNLSVRVLGVGSLNSANNVFVVSAADPTYDSGTNRTTFVVTAPLGFDKSTGTVTRTYIYSATSSWVGGSVPAIGDTAIIPVGGDVGSSAGYPAGVNIVVQGRLSFDALGGASFAYIQVESGGILDNPNNGAIASISGDVVIKSGGLWTQTGVSATNIVPATVIVESGGVLNTRSRFTSTTGGYLLVESGGVATITNSTIFTINGTAFVESGGSLTLISTITTMTMTGTIFIESGGSLNTGSISAYTGLIIAYTGATTTGMVPNVNLGYEKRTTHYTGDINNTIVTRNEAKTLYNFAGAAMTDCLAGNILSGKTIAGVPGSYVVVTPANVLAGVHFGAASSQTGTLDIAADNGTIVTVDLKVRGGVRWWWRRTIATLAAAGADSIHYTTDGSDPVPGQPGTMQYTEPFRVPTERLKAVAVVAGDPGLVTELNVV